MSNEINKAFVQQFNDEVVHLAQQDGSRLMNTVRIKTVNGKAANFERIGKVAAREKLTRHSDVTYDDTPHSRRKVYLRDFYHADLIDEEDELRMLIEPGSEYAKSFAWALGRQVDALILAAATGSALSVSAADAESSVSFDSNQVVDEDFVTADSDLTVDKLIEAKRLLMKHSGALREESFLVTNASGIASLLNATEVTSSDYNTVKALVRGEVDTFMGFKFIVLEDGMLEGVADGTATAPVICLAYTKSAIGFAKGRDISTRMEKIPEKHYATQVYTTMTGNAVRIEEEKVVKIECVQG